MFKSRRALFMMLSLSGLVASVLGQATPGPVSLYPGASLAFTIGTGIFVFFGVAALVYRLKWVLREWLKVD